MKMFGGPAKIFPGPRWSHVQTLSLPVRWRSRNAVTE